MKIIALISMLIDHIGVYLFPEIEVLRVIGRFALPLYSYLIVKGIRYTKDWLAYFIRIYGCAILTQIILWNFDIYKDMNVLFMFALAILLIKLRQKKGLLSYLLGLIILFLNIDYGLYGLIMLLGMYELYDRPANSLNVFMIALNMIYRLITGPGIQICSIFSVFIITNSKFQKRERLNKYIFYLFYPVHLLILNLIKYT